MPLTLKLTLSLTLDVAPALSFPIGITLECALTLKFSFALTPHIARTLNLHVKTTIVAVLAINIGVLRALAIAIYHGLRHVIDEFLLYIIIRLHTQRTLYFNGGTPILTVALPSQRHMLDCIQVDCLNSQSFRFWD